MKDKVISGVASDLLTASKSVEKLRKDAKLLNVVEAAVDTPVLLTHTYQIALQLTDSADEKNKSAKRLLMRHFELASLMSQAVAARIKKYNVAQEYEVLAGLCRLLPMTHFTVDKISSESGLSLVRGTDLGRFPLPMFLSSEKQLPPGEALSLQMSVLRSRFRAAAMTTSDTALVSASPTKQHHSMSDDADSDHKGSLLDTVGADRRVTGRNVCKWVQQLLTTLLAVSAQYMSVGDFALEDVFLDSDAYVVSALEQHRLMLAKNKRSSFAPAASTTTTANSTGGDDTAVAAAAAAAVPTVVLRPDELFRNIKYDADRNAWLDLHDKLFTGGQDRPADKAARDNKSDATTVAPLPSPSKRPAANTDVISDEPRLPSNSFDRSMLLQFDAHKTGVLALREREPKEMHVVAKYAEWAEHMRRDMRCLGIVLLQLVSHRVFPEPELRRLRRMHSDFEAVAAPPVPALPEFGAPPDSARADSSRDTAGPDSSRRRGSLKNNSTTRSDGPNNANSTPRVDETSRSRRGSFRNDNQPHSESRPTSSNNGGDKRRGSLKSGGEGHRRRSVVGEVTQGSADEDDGAFDLQISHDVLAKKDKRDDAAIAAMESLEAELADSYPAVHKLSAELRELLLLCFQAPQPLHIVTLKGKGNAAGGTRVECEAYTQLQHLNQKLQLAVLQQFNDAHHEKPSYWTDADERKRIKHNEQRAAELQRVAEQGLADAQKRVRAERFKLWYSVQSDDYKRRVEHVKKARFLSAQHKAERKRQIYLASLHVWPLDALQIWLGDAFLKYCTMLLELRQAISLLRRRKPEVYMTRIVSELLAPLSQQHTERILDSFGSPSGKQSKKKRNNTSSIDFSSTSTGSPPRGAQGIARSMSGDGSPSSPLRPTALPAGAASPSRKGAENPTTARTSMAKGGSSRSAKEFGVVPSLSVKLPSSPVATASKEATSGLRAGFAKSAPSKAVSAADSAASKGGAPVSPSSGKLLPVLSSAATGGTAKKKKAPPKMSEGALTLNIAASVQVLSQRLPIAVAACIESANDIFSFVRLARKGEEAEMLGAANTALITSAEQRLHKRMALQAALLAKQCKPLKKAAVRLCEEMGSLDRDWAKQLLHLLCLALAHHYEREIPIRAAGEEVAALKVAAFFRMVHVKYVVRQVWRRTEVEYAEQQRVKRNAVPKVPRQSAGVSKSFSQVDSALLRPLGDKLSVLDAVQEFEEQLLHGAAGLGHRSFALGSDGAEPLEELQPLSAAPKVMYAAEIQESLLHFADTLSDHVASRGGADKGGTKLPQIARVGSPNRDAGARTATPAKVKVLAQQEPLSVLRLACGTDSVQLDLAVNLLGDAVFAERKKKEGTQGGLEVHGADYYKFDDWRSVTCAAFLTRPPQADDTQKGCNANVSNIFVSTATEAPHPVAAMQTQYNPRPCTLPLLATDRWEEDRLFTVDLSQNDTLSINSVALGGGKDERVPRAVPTVERKVSELIVVLYSRKQVLYNMYAKTADEFRTNPAKYRPVDAVLTVLEPSAATQSEGIGSQDVDYSTVRMQCTLKGVAPNCRYRVSLQLDEYLSEDMVRDNKQYFEHIELTDPLLPAPPVPALNKQLVPSKLHAKIQLQLAKESGAKIGRKSTPVVSVQYVHTGCDWAVGRSVSAPKRLTVSLLDRLRTNAALPGRLSVTHTSIVYCTYPEQSTSLTVPQHPLLYFRQRDGADTSVHSAFNSFVKVEWEQSLSDRKEKTFYQLQRRLVVAAVNDIVLQGDWVTVAPNSMDSSSSAAETKTKTKQQRPSDSFDAMHVNNYHTDCISAPSILSKEQRATVLRHISARFPDLVAAGEGDDWLDAGLSLSVAYRVRAVNSFGAGKFSAQGAPRSEIALGAVVVSLSQLVKTGFYKHNVGHSGLVRQILTHADRSGTEEVQRTDHQSLEGGRITQIPTRNDRHEQVLSVQNDHLVAKDSTADGSSAGVGGMSAADSVPSGTSAAADASADIEDEEAAWLRELSLACPIK